ncbi:serine--tRNA ligase [Tepiditoga spiralis]|uniref:Serine--tRNA ligase n=1 Tax=Tepiditoga spiralis TaxID=2108365 RepID=A0A7G1GC04_9BACT|nr:serine--tRNA ligase [Tepiditoga spiralis]BBE32142.1 serine--tRNA ligase [Tepiditoga spiralis]
MLDIKYVRNNYEEIKDILIKRNADTKLLDELIPLDEKRRNLLKKVEVLRAERNNNSKKVSKLKKEGKNEEANKIIVNGKKIGEDIKKIEEEMKEIDEKYMQKLLYIPNIFEKDTPIGKDDNDNIELRKWGEPRKFKFEPKPHWDLGTNLNLIDFDRAAKLSGSRFAVLKGQIAKLERALINFMLNLHTIEHGYTEVLPPFMVTRETITATGQLPKFEEDLYNTKPDDMFLIPTAEVTLVGLRRNEVIENKDLPAKYVAYTPCFRREAGSYGRDVRGIIRQHQFDKVELVWHTKPETSEQDLETLTSQAEKVLQLLKLPYRVVRLCSGDLGFSAMKTYDIEVWLPSYNSYKEISSCSTTGDFQARRANIKFRDKDNKLKYVHTLNGSGLAVGRTLVAIMENYQLEDGRIEVPEVLRPFMGMDVIG